MPPLVRLTPPRETLGDIQPDRVLTGHGEGIDENAAEALEDALSNSRRRLPRALMSHGAKQIKTLTAAIRT